MNSHKNARLTLEGRKLLIERIAVMGLIAAAEAAGISRQTARKWLRRFEAGGHDALGDRSSRPDRTRSSLDSKVASRIEKLRRNRMPMHSIALVVGRSVATISRFLAGLGLSSGWEFAHVAIDDHSRAGFVQMHSDERKARQWSSSMRPWRTTRLWA